MNVPEDLNPTLSRQLQKAGLKDPSKTPSAEKWNELLRRINSYYQQTIEDRDLLSRSLELSTNEMQEVQGQLAAEREKLQDFIRALGEAMSVFREMAHPSHAVSQLQEVSEAVSQAKVEFATKVQELLGYEHHESDVSDVGTRSDVESIGRDFASLADHVVQLLKETAAGASMRRELEVASAVQQLLMPEQDLIERPFAQVAGFHQAAAACGGDWWTAHDLPDGRLLIAIGDVTGHGAAPAILTGVAKATCDVARTIHGGQLECSELLRLMNRAIYSAARQRLMMTCVVSTIDPRNRTLTIANAGHPFPLLLRSTRGSTKVHALPVHGAPLGGMQETVYQAERVELHREDVLFCYTDGVTECENERGEQFTERRLKSLLEHGSQWDARAIRDSVAHAMRRFRSEQSTVDDMTFVTARMTKL